VGGGHDLVGAVFCGAAWPATMLEFLGSFRDMEARLNSATHISLLSASDYSLPTPWARLVAGLLMLVVAGVLVRGTRRGPTTQPAFAVRWALAVSGTLLLSPHTQYYDVGILVLPVMLGLDFMLQQGHIPSMVLRVFLAAGFVLYPIYEWSPALHFQPLLLWPMLTFGWLTALAWRMDADDFRRPVQPVQPPALGAAHS
ncbi:MAG: hypothetical protein GY778_00290, partial [bacterium]|nr:hypothetical protein [bacterium]